MKTPDPGTEAGHERVTSLPESPVRPESPVTNGRHRRSRRSGKVDPCRQPGGASRPGAARHGRHVPRRRMGSSRQRCRRGRSARRRQSGAGISTSTCATGSRSTVVTRPEPYERRLVDAAVSAVAANPDVRTELVRRQRAWVEEHGGGVVEGRDIGTVVLPHADLKVYLTAAPNERAKRRARQRSDRTSVEQVEADLKRRDRLDSTRSDSPLPAPGQATDAIVVDSTHKSAASILEEVLRCLRAR